ERRRKVDVGAIGRKRGVGVEQAVGQNLRRRVGLNGGFKRAQIVVCWVRQSGRLGGGQIHHHHARESLGASEGVEIAAHLGDEALRPAAAGRSGTQTRFYVGEIFFHSAVELGRKRAALALERTRSLDQQCRRNIVSAEDHELQRRQGQHLKRIVR